MVENKPVIEQSAREPEREIEPEAISPRFWTIYLSLFLLRSLTSLMTSSATFFGQGA